MITVEQHASFTLIVEMGPEIYTAYNMPAALELLLKSFFDVLSGVFEVRHLASDHLHVNVLSD
jgi:hypothetical protein